MCEQAGERYNIHAGATMGAARSPDAAEFREGRSAGAEDGRKGGAGSRVGGIDRDVSIVSETKDVSLPDSGSQQEEDREANGGNRDFYFPAEDALQNIVSLASLVFSFGG